MSATELPTIVFPADGPAETPLERELELQQRLEDAERERDTALLLLELFPPQQIDELRGFARRLLREVARMHAYMHGEHCIMARCAVPALMAEAETRGLA